jgi:hypothetical protein
MPPSHRSTGAEACKLTPCGTPLRVSRSELKHRSAVVRKASSLSEARVFQY